MNFQKGDRAVCGVAQQKTVFRVFAEKKKVYTKNEQKTLEICRELDEAYKI